MKRLAGMAIASVLLLQQAAWASSYKGKCASWEGKFADCTISIQDGRFKTSYEAAEWQNLNTDISGEQITSLAASAVYNRSFWNAFGGGIGFGWNNWDAFGGGIGFGPLAFLGLLGDNSYTVLAISYEQPTQDTQTANAPATPPSAPGDRKVTAIRVRDSKTLLLRKELEALTGLKFENYR